MGKFWIAGENFATTTALKTAGKVIGAAAKKFEVVEVSASGAGIGNPPQDIMHEIVAAFLTNATAGTPGSSPTPSKMDQGGNNASSLTAGVNYSAESTAYETNAFPLDSFNQRSGMRWAVPKGEGYKTQGDATNLSFGYRVKSGVAGNIDHKCMWWEDY
jgi:hypothetical protein